MQELHLGRVPIKAWVDGVEFDDKARLQVSRIANLDIVGPHVAIMPDVHVGIGATVGSVIPTQGAIIPASVGVDLGCGMCVQKTSLRQEHLPDDLKKVRQVIERTVPVGMAHHKKVPAIVESAWERIEDRFAAIVEKRPFLRGKHLPLDQLATLGGGNHFIEVVIFDDGTVGVMLHSGSRGIGNRIGQTFIELAKKEMEKAGYGLPDPNLAYLREGTQHFDDYVEAVSWAQDFAALNREIMMHRVLAALRDVLPKFTLTDKVVSCHHNYVARETHFGQDLYVTRKGAVRAGKGELGIIPGSMGALSMIVRGLGNPESFESCSHGAGRRISRKAAQETITLKDLREQTDGVECRKDRGVIDEAPAAYKSIRAVMAAQADLVEVLHEMRQVVCVKG